MTAPNKTPDRVVANTAASITTATAITYATATGDWLWFEVRAVFGFTNPSGIMATIRCGFMARNVAGTLTAATGLTLSAGTDTPATGTGLVYEAVGMSEASASDAHVNITTSGTNVLIQVQCKTSGHTANTLVIADVYRLQP